MNISLEGRVRVYALPPTITKPSARDLIRHGVLVADTHNLIVTSGLQWATRKLGHILGTPPVQVGGETLSDIDELVVSKIKLGNSAAPAAPNASDTALADLTPLLTLSTLSVSYPASNQVRWSATIAPNTINGQAVTEIGLFCTINSNDILIGRALTSPPIVVAPATAYTVTYTISLSAS